MEVRDQVSVHSVDQCREVEIWPEEEFVTKVSRQIDKETRQEEVAKKNRSFWAKDLLMEKIWDRVKLRQDILRLSKKILLEEWRKVMFMAKGEVR